MDIGPKCALGTGPAAWDAVETLSGSVQQLCICSVVHDSNMD